MISVIVYGRNDTHGYNPHRRAALSLNCVAEVLTDEDDEIVFVDYNTPDELPTLPEAFADTLTARCLSLLRVIRVPAAIHAQRFEQRTHLPMVEPVARNVAARRSNPANRWILSTTTDMIFVPSAEGSLTEICGSLPDGFYALPRFELPEWLWEQLPRSDPIRALAEVRRLGPALALDEPTLSHDWIRFDAPGDFQLVLRSDFFALDGFDERMVLGWHVDSNLSRRLAQLRGGIESLEGRVGGYHCNHSRTMTIYHDAGVANDLGRFVYELDDIYVLSQRETWGLRDLRLDEIDVGGRAGPSFAAAVEAAIEGSVPRSPFDARDAKYALEYDSAHILPFVADSLRMSPPDAQIGYVGANPLLERMLAGLVTNLDLTRPLLVAEPSDPMSVAELSRCSDVFVVDLGVDTSLLDQPLALTPNPELRELRTKLVRTFDALERLVELERSRLVAGEHPRRFVLVNSSAVYWNAYVLAELSCSTATPHARVRRAFVKAAPDDARATRAASVRAHQLLRWISRRDSPDQRLRIRDGEKILMGDLEDYSGFGRGWAFPDKDAIWTEGPRSELALALEDVARASWLVLGFDDIRVHGDEHFRVDLIAGGERLDTAEFGQPTHKRARPVRQIARTVGLTRIGAARWLYLLLLAARRYVGATVRRVMPYRKLSKFRLRARLPVRALEEGAIDLMLEVTEPSDWPDGRRPRLHLTSVGIERGSLLARAPGGRRANVSRSP